ncbi:MAG: formylglycine-generating enzyme family protein [Planctomycetaceae bacterium]|nr:formylglycine-generating enzyme family protein [Planctomycetaceae bacterium]
MQESEPRESIPSSSLLELLAPSVPLSGGMFSMGNNQAGNPEERPEHEVELDPFWIDVYEVTNQQFRLFVEATGYVTSAEKRGWSYLFDEKQKGWVKMPGANWRAPFPINPATNNGDQWVKWPVVHVSWDDANAYCSWTGKQLPTEAQWEFAARGGLIDCEYPWGNTREPQGQILANYWQGWFPEENTQADGYLLLAPVGSFPKNGYGLYDMAGNAAEWCQDDYDPAFYLNSPRKNPCRTVPSSEPALKVVRGGSFLSAENADTGYRVSARQGQSQDMSFVHIGFRTVGKNEN